MKTISPVTDGPPNPNVHNKFLTYADFLKNEEKDQYDRYQDTKKQMQEEEPETPKPKNIFQSKGMFARGAGGSSAASVRRQDSARKQLFAKKKQQYGVYGM